MAFVTAIGDIFPLVTAITDTNVSNGCDNGAVIYFYVYVCKHVNNGVYDKSNASIASVEDG